MNKASKQRLFRLAAIAVFVFSVVVLVWLVPSPPGSAQSQPAHTPTPAAPEIAGECHPAYDLHALPGGVVGYYEPDVNNEYGPLSEGAPYHIIGRYGNDWLYLRLPAAWGYAGNGQLWVRYEVLTGLDVSSVKDYQGE
jgi:hypothetical protein